MRKRPWKVAILGKAVWEAAGQEQESGSNEEMGGAARKSKLHSNALDDAET